MSGKQQKRAKTEQDMAQIEELKEQINNLPKDNPKLCEGLIRELHKKISKIGNESEKEKLHFELKAASGLGLSEELRQMLETNGLQMEGLHLVLKYLNTKSELAQYFFNNPVDPDENGVLNVLRRRLGLKLEVLGGLSAKGIDVTKDWVQRLVTAAPSLQSLSRISVRELEKLCEGASHGEREDVDRLVKIAESRASKIAAAQDEKEIGARDGSEKAIDQEKLEKAKALMNEAKEMAKKESDEAKRAVNEKVGEISKTLRLPPDWNKYDIGTEPKQLFGQLDAIIEQLNSVIEVGEAYKSDLEVVRKASGGRALCGIYHSKYFPPITAELPIIVMPHEVTLASPNNSQQVRYVKFSKSRAAADYVQAMKSSSSNIGLHVGGFYQLFVGDISGSYATRSEEDETKSEKKQSSSASVVQYIWTATKTFKIDQEQLKLSASARKMARDIMDEETARRFMQRYGSHFPNGLHTLGGVLFRIVDAESSSMKGTSVLTEKAAQHLQGQLSFGFLGGMFGIGLSIRGEHSSSSGKTEAHEKEAEDISYTFSSQAMGPATTNPAAFNTLLSNNSTWAIIDRGSQNAYLPMWELIRDLGSDFKDAATFLEYTWRKDEAERRHKIAHKKGKEDPRSKIKMAYISNITFIVSGSQMAGIPNMIHVDMNSDSGGEYIYPVKHFSDNKDEAIAGLAFIQNDAIVPDNYTKIEQDLNKGAGGNYNYLCITKLGKNKMTDIDFLASSDKRNDDTINGYFRFGADVNASGGGDYVYLLYKTNTGKPFE